jgi:hypothetical protein
MYVCVYVCMYRHSNFIHLQHGCGKNHSTHRHVATVRCCSATNHVATEVQLIMLWLNVVVMQVVMLRLNVVAVQLMMLQRTCKQVVLCSEGYVPLGQMDLKLKGCRYVLVYVCMYVCMVSRFGLL